MIVRQDYATQCGNIVSRLEEINKMTIFGSLTKPAW